MPVSSLMMPAVDEERVFRALSDSHRRELLDLLFQRDGQTLSELDAHLPMTRFGTMKHLRMLESAGLVLTRREGRKKLHFLNPEPIRTIHQHWISKYAGGASKSPDAHAHAHSNGSSHAPSAGKLGAEATPLRHAYEVFVRTSPEVLWDAITRPVLCGPLQGLRVEGEWGPGSRLMFVTPQGRRAAEGTVLHAAPPSLLVHSFSALWNDAVTPEPPHKVTWTVKAMGPVCRLQVEHDGFPAVSETLQAMRAGTSPILNGIKTLIETGQPLPFRNLGEE